MWSLIELLNDRRTRVAAATLFLLVALQTLIGPLDLAISADGMTVGLDNVVAIKLLLACAMFAAAAWGFFQYRSVRLIMGSWPGVLIAALLFMTIVGASSGVVSSSPLVSVISYIGFVFVATALTVLGLRAFAFAICVGVLANAVWGLFLFYFLPDQGIFAEPIENGQFALRLGGLAHPNSIGRSMCIGTLLMFYLYRCNELPRVAGLACLALLGWNMLLAKSRTAIIACMIGLMVLMLDRLRTRAGIVAAVVAIMLGVGGFFVLAASGQSEKLVDKLVSSFSKTGSVEEITSGTGRTDIWAEAMSFVRQRPFLGYGLNTGPILLVDHSQATHNAVMYGLLAGGVFGGLFMILLQLQLIWIGLQAKQLVVRSVAVFLFISCLTEDTVLETFPGPGTLMWYTCFAMTLISQWAPAGESPWLYLLKKNDRERGNTTDADEPAMPLGGRFAHGDRLSPEGRIADSGRFDGAGGFWQDGGAWGS